MGVTAERARTKGDATKETGYRDGDVPDHARVRYAGSGVNGAALAATAIGCFLAWIGLLVKPLAFLYDYAWFAGAGGAALAYWLLMAPERRRQASLTSPLS